MACYFHRNSSSYIPTICNPPDTEMLAFLWVTTSWYSHAALGHKTWPATCIMQPVLCRLHQPRGQHVLIDIVCWALLLAAKTAGNCPDWKICKVKWALKIFARLGYCFKNNHSIVLPLFSWNCTWRIFHTSSKRGMTEQKVCTFRHGRSRA